jgi:hypothetical protein
MADPTDRPARQAEPDSGDQGDELVRLDVGGWISGPCLSADELADPEDWLPEPTLGWPADGGQRPAP